MGLFDGLFGKKKEKEESKPLPFVLMDKMEQLDKINELSGEKLVAIFKHSTRCGTSRMAFNSFQRGFNMELEDDVLVYIVDVLSNRDISDEVTSRFQILHESPQLILIKNGKMVDHYSHHRITPSALEQHV